MPPDDMDEEDIEILDAIRKAYEFRVRSILQKANECDDAEHKGTYLLTR